MNYHCVIQIVKIPTRAQKILDVFVTNVPNYWGKVGAVKGLVRSDQLAILVKHVVQRKANNISYECYKE